MVALIHGPDVSDALAKWAAARIPHVGEAGFSQPCLAIGIASSPSMSAELYGVLVFHDHQPEARTCQISVAATSPKWVFGCKELFRHAFNTMNCFMLWTATPVTNKRAIRWNEGIGFRREAYLHHYYGPGKHAVICRMLRPEWEQSYWCNQQKKAA